MVQIQKRPGADPGRFLITGTRATFPSTIVLWERARSGRSAVGVRIAQDIAPAPNRMDVVVAFGCRLNFLTQFADKNVNNLEFRLIHATIQVVEEHFLGQCRAFTQRQQFKNAIFITGQMQW